MDHLLQHQKLHTEGPYKATDIYGQSLGRFSSNFRQCDLEGAPKLSNMCSYRHENVRPYRQLSIRLFKDVLHTINIKHDKTDFYLFLQILLNFRRRFGDD